MHGDDEDADDDGDDDDDEIMMMSLMIDGCCFHALDAFIIFLHFCTLDALKQWMLTNTAFPAILFLGCLDILEIPTLFVLWMPRWMRRNARIPACLYLEAWQ